MQQYLEAGEADEPDEKAEDDEKCAQTEGEAWPGTPDHWCEAKEASPLLCALYSTLLVPPAVILFRSFGTTIPCFCVVATSTSVVVFF